MAAHPYTHVGGGNGVWTYRVEFDAGTVVEAARAAQQAALPKLGAYIKEESNAIAPLREGALIGSSKVEPNGDSVIISYNTIYAHYQHEGTSLNHPNGRQAKYLESVMDDPATLQAAQDIFNAELQSRL